MKLKQFIGKSAERNRVVVIKNCYGNIIAKGAVMDVYNNESYEQILERDIDCFFFANEKLYITIDEP